MTQPQPIAHTWTVELDALDASTATYRWTLPTGQDTPGQETATLTIPRGQYETCGRLSTAEVHLSTPGAMTYTGGTR